MEGHSYNEGTTIVQYCQNCTCRNRTFECVGESCKVNCTRPDVFQCQTSEQCIPADYRCDGMWDCADASDEYNCEERNCSDSFFACRTDPMSRQCIPEHYVCDGIPNCADGSDEDADICGGNCTAYQYRCQSGYCIDRDFVCDHDFDCADGDDELRCQCHNCVRNCTQFDFYCTRHTCISSNFTCDGVDDCGDGSDEMGCLTTPALSSECVPDSQWGPWGPCLPSGNGTTVRELQCNSCCEGFVQRNETKRCFECQCYVTLEAANDALQPAGIILESGDVLGHITGGKTVYIDDDGVYLESGLTIDIGPCIECECTQPNCTFTCRLDTCLTTTPSPTSPTTTSSTITTTPPDCWTTWTSWTSCRLNQCSTSTRERFCQTSNPACGCGTPSELQIMDCPCTTTTQPFTTKVSTACTRGCRNICEDTCRHYNISDCIYTTPEWYTDCTCKRCPAGYLEDDIGECVRVEDCPCFHNGTSYPVGFHITYPERCEQCACDSGGVYNCSRIPDCCVYGEWGPWGDCSVGCGTGIRSRRKVSLSPECPEVIVEEQPCSSFCQCVMNGTEYPVDSRMSPCYTCECINEQCATVWSPEANATWSEWAAWTVCEGENNCRDHRRSRCRTCQNSCGFGGCPGPAMEEEPCNSSPCCSNYLWSDWSLCSTTCGLGNQVRQKRFRDNATATDCVNTNTQQEQTCGNPSCICDSMGSSEWSAWSECRSPNNESCGYGTQARERTLPPCEGIVTRQERSCFIGNCECAAGQVYSNHSTCHPFCNKPVSPLCNLTTQAACVCPMGKYRDMDSGACVTKDVCDQCKYGNRTYNPGDEWECGQCTICSCCGDGKVIPVPKQCPNVSTCDLTTHKLVPSASPCCIVDCVPKRCEVHVGPPINVTVGDCVSVHPVPNQYCYGDCLPSWHGVDYVLSTLKQKECTCCSAHEVSYQNIILACPDGTHMQHSIPKLKSCKCGPTACHRNTGYTTDHFVTS